MQIHPALVREVNQAEREIAARWTVPLHLNVTIPIEDPNTATWSLGEIMDSMQAYAYTLTAAPFPVTLNGLWFGADADPNHLRGDLLESETTAQNPAQIIKHEYGHVLMGSLSPVQQMNLIADLAEEISGNYTGSDIIRLISRYGSTSAPETVAELFNRGERGETSALISIVHKHFERFRRVENR